MARPSKFNQQTAEKIIAALKAGNTLKASAAYQGVSESTLARWRERFGDFDDQIRIAEASAEVMYAAVLAKAAQDGDWRAALSWLERRRHEDWRERKSTDVTGSLELVGHLSDEELEARIAELEAGTRAVPRSARGAAATPVSD